MEHIIIHIMLSGFPNITKRYQRANELSPLQATENSK